jgi:Na+/H+-dicarboxylate symporter
MMYLISQLFVWLLLAFLLGLLLGLFHKSAGEE